MSGKTAALLLAVSLLLCGCGAEEPTETTPSVTTEQTVVTEVTEITEVTEVTEETEVTEKAVVTEPTEAVKPPVQQEQIPTEDPTTQPVPETTLGPMPDYGINLPDDVWDD